MRLLPTLALALPVLCCSCSATFESRNEPAAPSAGKSKAAAPQEAAAQAQAAKPAAKPADKSPTGVLVPAEFEAISLWPEAYSGEWMVLEVLPQGSAVEAGQVIAKLDRRTLEEQLDGARSDLRSAQVQHDGLVAKSRIAEESAKASLARARSGLARSKRALEGYRERELAFSRRGDALSKLRETYRVEDQVDELAQLEAMYEADELTDATEEIVLKRSRRNLDMTRQGNQLSRDRRKYQEDFSEAMQLQARQEAFDKQELELDHLVRTQAVDALSREDALLRSTESLHKKHQKLARLDHDLELTEITAPRAGVLLYGSERDWRTGGGTSQLVRGSRLAARTDVFLVAAPERLAVALEIPESLMTGALDGTSVVVRPVAPSGVELAGTLSLSAYPGSRKGSESSFEGSVRLERSEPGLVAGMHVRVELDPKAK